jgi:hypothetical protein
MDGRPKVARIRSIPRRRCATCLLHICRSIGNQTRTDHHTVDRSFIASRLTRTERANHALDSNDGSTKSGSDC